MSTTTACRYEGIRVVEFTHMVMGPTCGMILADLGAEVIKVEPLGGDSTRRLLGSGAGFFSMFNRNKQSMAVDVKDARGREVVLKLVAGADIFSENFKGGTMEKLGFGPEALTKLNPRLVYVSHKGFLAGPYEQRTALDEVVQMMGGLAYMTGREGRPLRAGTSVNDIMGGMFGAIGALAALQQRDSASGTGQGRQVQSALFENNVFLVAQHMMQFAVTGKAAAPMPSRISGLGACTTCSPSRTVSRSSWLRSATRSGPMCREFGFDEMLADPLLATNNDRVRARDWMLPMLRAHFATFSAAELGQRFERIGLPYAPITRPQDLFDDPHLLATGGLAPVSLPADVSGAGRAIETRTALLPLALDGQRLPLRLPPPPLGAQTDTLLHSLGYSRDEIAALRAANVIGAHPEGARAATEPADA